MLAQAALNETRQPEWGDTKIQQENSLSKTNIKVRIGFSVVRSRFFHSREIIREHKKQGSEPHWKGSLKTPPS